MDNIKTNKKIRFVILIFILIFLIICLKVIYIQVFEYDKLKKLANSLWSRNLPIEADRGIIYDVNGIMLANNITTT